MIHDKSPVLARLDVWSRYLSFQRSWLSNCDLQTLLEIKCNAQAMHLKQGRECTEEQNVSESHLSPISQKERQSQRAGDWGKKQEERSCLIWSDAVTLSIYHLPSDSCAEYKASATSVWLINPEADLTRRGLKIYFEQSWGQTGTYHRESQAHSSNRKRNFVLKKVWWLWVQASVSVTAIKLLA